ncbi:MAG: aldehyde dehydrogenase [Lachnospiraceae bacterium]
MTAEQLLKRQRKAFLQGRTLDTDFRRGILRRLGKNIEKYQPEIEAALKKDLNKSSFESYMTETGLILSSLSYMLKHLDSWTKRKLVPTPIAQMPAVSFVIREPYGNVLVMAPWNYPFLLAMEPFIGAIAAGNCCIVKPSEYAPNTGNVIKTIIEQSVPSWLGAVVLGDQAVSEKLLDCRFDYIFFTGSPAVGKEVLKKAALHLTPVTLELGGKSPCIVEKSADIRMAAKRIVFGKFLNAGQTCVAPDYILVQRSVKKELIRWIKYWTWRQLGENPLLNSDYPRIVSRKHYDRLVHLLDGENLLFGGERREDTLQIGPALLDEPSWDRPVMKEEIFGPILPIISIDSVLEAERIIKRGEKPLALYLFTSRKLVEEYILDNVSFGGGCINDTVIHLATNYLPFGGVGNSGMGAYHGKYTFETFTREKSVQKKTVRLDLPVRYQPYTKAKEKWLKRFL